MLSFLSGVHNLSERGQATRKWEDDLLQTVTADGAVKIGKACDLMKNKGLCNKDCTILTLGRHFVTNWHQSQPDRVDGIVISGMVDVDRPACSQFFQVCGFETSEGALGVCDEMTDLLTGENEFWWFWELTIEFGFDVGIFFDFVFK